MIEYLNLGTLIAVIIKSLDRIADDPDRLKKAITGKEINKESGGLAKDIRVFGNAEWTKRYGHPNNLP